MAFHLVSDLLLRAGVGGGGGKPSWEVDGSVVGVLDLEMRVRERLINYGDLYVSFTFRRK